MNCSIVANELLQFASAPFAAADRPFDERRGHSQIAERDDDVKERIDVEDRADFLIFPAVRTWQILPVQDARGKRKAKLFVMEHISKFGQQIENIDKDKSAGEQHQHYRRREMNLKPFAL